VGREGTGDGRGDLGGHRREAEGAGEVGGRLPSGRAAPGSAALPCLRHRALRIPDARYGFLRFRFGFSFFSTRSSQAIRRPLNN
jgi:hypothetical protein